MTWSMFGSLEIILADVSSEATIVDHREESSNSKVERVSVSIEKRYV